MLTDTEKKEILIDVLDGRSMTFFAEKHGLTRERISGIFHTQCRLSNIDVYEHCEDISQTKKASLPLLRTHKKEFLDASREVERQFLMTMQMSTYRSSSACVDDLHLFGEEYFLENMYGFGEKKLGRLKSIIDQWALEPSQNARELAAVIPTLIDRAKVVIESIYIYERKLLYLVALEMLKTDVYPDPYVFNTPCNFEPVGYDATILRKFSDLNYRDIEKMVDDLYVLGNKIFRSLNNNMSLREFQIFRKELGKHRVEPSKTAIDIRWNLLTLINDLTQKVELYGYKDSRKVLRYISYKLVQN